MIEIKMPLIRIIEWRDGAIFKTEPAGEVWISSDIAISGKQYGDDPNLRLGTPTNFEVRHKNE